MVKLALQPWGSWTLYMKMEHKVLIFTENFKHLSEDQFPNKVSSWSKAVTKFFLFFGFAMLFCKHNNHEMPSLGLHHSLFGKVKEGIETTNNITLPL